MRGKRLRNTFYIFVIVLGLINISGCARPMLQKPETKKEVSKPSKKKEEKKQEKKQEKKEEKGDNVIVAGGIDTSSKFDFSVTEALIGFNYTEEPIVVLAGSFTNNSDEPISFSWALDVTATQGGFTLPTAYLSGTSDFNYNEIQPKSTIPVFVGWKIADGEQDITLKVVDQQHYAKEEIYAQTFTVEELIKNTENYQDSEGIISEPMDL